MSRVFRTKREDGSEAASGGCIFSCGNEKFGIKLNIHRIIMALVVGIALLGLLAFAYYLKGKNDFYISTLTKVIVLGCMIGTVVFVAVQIVIPKFLRLIGSLAGIVAISFWLFDSLEHFVNDFSLFIPEARIYNVIIIACFILIFLGIFRNAGIAILLGGGITTMFYLVDYYVIQFRKTPVLFTDILATKVALGVAGNYRFVLREEFLKIVFLLIFFSAVSSVFTLKQFNISWKISVSAIALSLGIIPLMFFLNTDFFRTKGLVEIDFMPLMAANRNGLLVSDFVNTHNAKLRKPDGYSDEIVKKIMGSYESDVITAAEIDNNNYPNIILIMNESFSDLTYLETPVLSEDNIPQFRNMMDNCVKGTLISSIWGGNTPNSEFECLTGCTITFLNPGTIAFQQIISSELPTVASHLKGIGYSTTAIHLYEPEYFDRKRIYPLLGMDNFINLQNPPEVEIAFFRDYATDKSSFDAIIADQEKQSGHIFSYCVTIQNHGGYYWGTDSIKVLNGNSPYANEYASLMKITDDEFQVFLDYFEHIDTPTIVCMFGDHQPTLEDGFYDAIWDGRTYSDVEKRYMECKVPFVIWANYDIDEKDVGTTSINYLGAMLMETAGMPMSGFYKYLLDLQKDMPVICTAGFVDKDGNFAAREEDCVFNDRLRDYRYLQYNYLKGNINREFYEVITE